MLEYIYDGHSIAYDPIYRVGNVINDQQQEEYWNTVNINT